MTELNSYFTNDGTELHRGCDGEIMNFKEGWICGECKEGGEWAAQIAPTENTEGASSTMQKRQPGVPVTASTEAPNTKDWQRMVGGVGTRSPELDALVRQHYQRLDEIISGTIRALEALKSCIPDAAPKDEITFYTGIGGTATSHTGHLKGHPCTDKCKPLELPNPVDYMRNRGG